MHPAVSHGPFNSFEGVVRGEGGTTATSMIFWGCFGGGRGRGLVAGKGRGRFRGGRSVSFFVILAWWVILYSILASVVVAPLRLSGFRWFLRVVIYEGV